MTPFFIFTLICWLKKIPVDKWVISLFLFPKMCKKLAQRKSSKSNSVISAKITRNYKNDEALKLSMSHKIVTFLKMKIHMLILFTPEPFESIAITEKNSDDINTRIAPRWKTKIEAYKRGVEIFQNQQDEENKFHLHFIVIDMFTRCVFNSESNRMWSGLSLMLIRVKIWSEPHIKQNEKPNSLKRLKFIDISVKIFFWIDECNLVLEFIHFR